VIQLIALAVIFIFPELVSAELEPKKKIDLDTIEINVDSYDTGGGGGYGAGYGGGTPGFALPEPAIPGAEDSPPAAPQEESAAPAEPDPNQMLMDALKEGAKKK
ncbi:MAG: hypothetical protein KDE10_14915, partial [Rhodobacteraceae bacterium]|nr:hypothetical protein [Paracoccaceae bacterium]